MPARIGITARRSADALPALGQTVTLGPEHQGQPVESGHRLLERDGVLGQRQGDGVEPAALEIRQGVVPVGQAGPGQGEHRAHGHLHRPAVERVGAPRREQHRVDAERGGAAEDGADVGVVDDVLADHDGAGALEHLVERGQRRARERGQRAAVDVEAGDLLGEGLGDHEAGRVGRLRGRRPARRASAAPSGRSGPGSRPRRPGVRPSRPRRGTARARPRATGAAGRRAGRGSRPGAGRRGRRSRRTTPAQRSLPGRSGRGSAPDGPRPRPRRSR